METQATDKPMEELKPVSESRNGKLPPLIRAYIVGRESLPIRLPYKLKPFREFDKNMRDLPQIKNLPREQRQALLKQLYQAAKEKESWDEIAWCERKKLEVLRSDITALSYTAGLLSQALRSLEQAQKQCSQVLEVLEKDRVDRLRSAQIVAYLKGSIAVARELRARCAAAIYSRWRRTGEKRIVDEGFPADWLPIVAPELPFQPTSKSSATEHWFIKQARICVDRHFGAAKKLRRDQIIYKAFKAAFTSSSQTEESVRRELSRQSRGKHVFADHPPVIIRSEHMRKIEPREADELLRN